MPDIQINYRIGGKNVPLERIGDLSLRAVLGNAARDVREKVGKLSCPSHDGTLVVEIQGQSGSQVRYTVHGCCENMTERVKQALP